MGSDGAPKFSFDGLKVIMEKELNMTVRCTNPHSSVTFVCKTRFLRITPPLLAPTSTRCLQLVHTEECPFLIREHVRKYQWGCSHITVWRKATA